MSIQPVHPCALELKLAELVHVVESLFEPVTWQGTYEDICEILGIQLSDVNPFELQL